MNDELWSIIVINEFMTLLVVRFLTKTNYVDKTGGGIMIILRNWGLRFIATEEFKESQYLRLTV